MCCAVRGRGRRTSDPLHRAVARRLPSLRLRPADRRAVVHVRQAHLPRDDGMGPRERGVLATPLVVWGPPQACHARASG